MTILTETRKSRMPMRDDDALKKRPGNESGDSKDCTSYLEQFCHDLGNPLGGILSLCEHLLLDENIIKGEHRECVELIETAAEQISSILDKARKDLRNGRIS